MKDFVGQTIEIGSKVVHGASGRYGGLHGPYYVIRMTAKKVGLSRSPDGPEARLANLGNVVVVQS